MNKKSLEEIMGKNHILEKNSDNWEYINIASKEVLLTSKDLPKMIFKMITELNFSPNNKNRLYEIMIEKLTSYKVKSPGIHPTSIIFEENGGFPNNVLVFSYEENSWKHENRHTMEESLYIPNEWLYYLFEFGEKFDKTLTKNYFVVDKELKK